MRAELDGVIVGAGLAGCLAAVALTRAGLRIGLVEARPVPRTVPAPDRDMRALVINEASRRVLAELDVWPRLARHAMPVRAICVTERGSFGSAWLRASDADLDALGWTCPADVLLSELSACAVEMVGDALAGSASFASLEASMAGVRVSAIRDGAPLEMHARLLVGADGTGSAVRAALGIEVDRFDYGQQAIVANVEVERPLEGTAFERFTGQGPIAMLPLRGARYVSVQCLDDDAARTALACDDAVYLLELQRRFGDRLGRLTSLGPRRAHALVRSRARAVAAGRSVLVGNAACTMHPNGAQGWNLGVRDVAALVGAVRGAPDPGAESVTGTYARARRSDHRLTVAFTDALAQGFRSPLVAAGAARRAALWAVAACKPVRRALIAGGSGLAPLARTRELTGRG